MRKKLQFILIISLLVFAIVFVSFKPIVVAKYPKGSMIANVSVEKLADDQVRHTLDEAIEIWQLGDDLILKSDYEKFIVPRSAIQFDIDGTIKTFKEKTKRHYSNFFLGQKNVMIPIEIEIDENIMEIKNLARKSYINTEKTLLNVIEVASQLRDEQISIHYHDVADIELETIAEQAFDIPEWLSNAVLTYAINELDGHVIAPNDAFSFLNTVGLPEKMPQSDEELSFLASTLYSLLLQTNFEIISRETDIYKPSFIDKGLDVSINREEQIDFIVQNPNEFSYKINVQKVQGKIEISLNSFPADLTYDYEIKNAESVQQRTIHRYSKNITPGQSELISPGEEGFKGDVYRHSFNNNGVLIDSEFISHEFSLPKPRIVLLPTKEVEETPESDDIVNEDYMSLVDFEDEIEKLEIEIEEIVTNYLDQVNEEMEKEFDDFIDQYFDVIELIEAEEEQEIEKMIEQLEEEIKQSENNKETLRYQFLLDVLTNSMMDDVKEG